MPPLPDLGAVLWRTHLGHVWLLRTAIGAALGLGLYLSSRRKAHVPRGFSPVDGMIMASSGALLISLAGLSQVATGFHRQLLHLLADAPHLLVGAIWPIGLIPMACYLWQARGRNQTLPASREIKVLQRFSKTALVAVLALVMTGLVDGWVMIGSWSVLITTPHGQLFLAKMGVVAVMIAIGAFCRMRLMPQIHDVPGVMQRLEKAVWVESGLALLVVLIVSLRT
jgi:putative copper resistance protein D